MSPAALIDGQAWLVSLRARRPQPPAVRQVIAPPLVDVGVTTARDPVEAPVEEFIDEEGSRGRPKQKQGRIGERNWSRLRRRWLLVDLAQTPGGWACVNVVMSSRKFSSRSIRPRRFSANLRISTVRSGDHSQTAASARRTLASRSPG